MIYSLPHIESLPGLKVFISDIYYFESQDESNNIIANNVEPNGKLKLIFPIENGITIRCNNKTFHLKQNQIALAGIFDTTFRVDSSANRLTKAIIIEFISSGAYRFFSINHIELSNRFYPLYDLAGSSIIEIETQIQEEPILEKKIFLLQKYLLSIFIKTESDFIFDYCIEKISNNKGIISIRELERLTGYSSRWLNKKFEYKLGINPKTFASIIRFHTVLKSLAFNLDDNTIYKMYYQYYFDQPHFIKEFKRFSGYTPNKFLKKILHPIG
jgi:AraC-like DNA-binding protein